MTTPSAGALTLASDQSFWTTEQRAALVQIGLEDAPNADLAVFLHYCQRTGMDPFTRQIYMIGRWDGRAQRLKYTIQMAIDGFRIVAERSGQYAGQTEPQWCGDDGVWHDVWVAKIPPVAARIGVYRKGWSHPTYAVAHFAEYAPRKKDGALEPMWQRMPANQLAKCSEAAALRKAFPHDLSGLYIPEEMERADDIPSVVPGDVEDQAPEVIDWTARIAECTGDYDKLIDLYKEARGLEPNNAELLESIAAAGHAAKGEPTAA